MKKILNGVVNYNGKPARIAAKITDVSGYVSITAEIIPYRCKTVHVCGCLHNEICEAFPQLRPFMWLHMVHTDGSIGNEGADGLHYLVNGYEAAARRLLCCCSDREFMELSALVRYGLHKSKTAWGSYTVDGDGLKIYEKLLNSYNLPARRLNAIKDFYGVLAGLQ